MATEFKNHPAVDRVMHIKDARGVVRVCYVETVHRYDNGTIIYDLHYGNDRGDTRCVSFNEVNLLLYPERFFFVA